MPDLLADRFLHCGSAWMDLATGATVRVRIGRAGVGSEPLIWNDRCATLAVLRHPLLNQLVDYGHADATRTFEAYTAAPPVGAPAGAGPRLLRHAVRFLEAHGLCLGLEMAQLALREVCTTRGSPGQPLGLVLQPRRALAAVDDVLADTAPGGVTSIEIVGTVGMGVRTLLFLAARAARLQGYTPVCASAFGRVPGLASTLADRHVCVLIEPGVTSLNALGAFVAGLGVSSARRHVLVRFGRGVPAAARRLVLEPMGVTAMISMVFVDDEQGPDSREVFAAARAADGNPGRFLTQLGAAPFAGHRPAIAMVRESAPAYRIASSPRPEMPARRAPRRSILSAAVRAERLAARGRHASAIRLLARAARVLELRGDTATAARCREQLGWILRDRGRTRAALEEFARARALAPAGADALRSTIATGVAWTDECRFPEAEAALRTAVAGTELLAHEDLHRDARLALGRCLLWQRRYDEARLALAPVADGRHDRLAHTLALMARIHVAAGEYPQAVATASRALEIAGARDPRALAGAWRAMALAQAALGDRQGLRTSIRDGLAAAAAAHLPLAALRLRAILLAAVREDRTDERQRLMAQIRSALARGPLTPLLRLQLEGAAEQAPDAARAARPDPRHSAIEDLPHLLEIAFGAIDDRTAVTDVCRSVFERLRAASVQVVSACPERRVLVRAGRAGDITVVERALAAGGACAATAPDEPGEAAHAIRYNNDTIAVVACRWTATADPDLPAALGLLRACAMAIAPSVRALLDRQPVQAAEAAWRDLIGSGAPVAALRDAIARAARAPFPVLIEGESGSGKELVARAIHRLSPRRERRLCAVNCAAISEELLEAELFGHARGAFTGAVGERAGLFEEADGGTLFLDEVAELSQRAQAKLLRVLQDGEVRRVGENFARRVDARVVAATNRRLEEEVEAGRFRTDLRFRLDVVRIAVPPLRERAMDIPLLTAHFWDEASRRVESRASLAPETVVALTRYEWPGNVRQLQNVIASLAVHAPRRGRVPPSLLPAQIARSAGPAASTFDAAREDFERRFVTSALAQAGGHRSRAARALGVTRQGLAKMLRRLRIDADSG